MLRFRHIIVACTWLSLLSIPGSSQAESPRQLKSEARALTVAEVSALGQQAGEGDARAQMMFGVVLLVVAERVHGDSQGSREIFQLATYWFRKAAEKGFAPAQYFLATGSGLEPLVSCKEAVEWLNKAIDRGYAPAMTRMGNFYTGAQCVKRDYALGIQWLQKGVQHGDASASYRLGKLYEQGWGATRNQGEANKWFLRGAQLGDPESQNAIGINLAEGIGMERDDVKAVEWFQKGAEQGGYMAACNLALHYMRGHGVEKNYVLSLMWGLVADANATGVGCLSEDFEELAKMTPAQEAEARHLANAWLKAHNSPPLRSP